MIFRKRECVLLLGLVRVSRSCPALYLCMLAHSSSPMLMGLEEIFHDRLIELSQLLVQVQDSARGKNYQ